MTIIVDANGAIVLPEEVRQRLGIVPGSQLEVEADERGVLLRPIGNVVYFMPPYVITPAEIDLMVEVALEGIDRACA